MTMPSTNRLHTYLAAVVGLEAAIEQTLKQLLEENFHHPQVATLLSEFHTLTKEQLYALDVRLQTLADDVPIPDRGAAIHLDAECADSDHYPASTALQTVYCLYNRALIEYATLQVIAIRYRDSWAVAEDGTTAHLARQHTQDYARAIGQLSRVFHDVVVWEMEGEGSECQCVCPSCSLGVCLCPAASRTILSQALAGAGSLAVEAGIYVNLPRQGSAALEAGLLKGDVVVAVDGHEVQTYGDLQTAVRNHHTGEVIQFQVRRGAEGQQVITVIRP